MSTPKPGSASPWAITGPAMIVAHEDSELRLRVEVARRHHLGIGSADQQYDVWEEKAKIAPPPIPKPKLPSVVDLVRDVVRNFCANFGVSVSYMQDEDAPTISARLFCKKNETLLDFDEIVQMMVTGEHQAACDLLTTTCIMVGGTLQDVGIKTASKFVSSDFGRQMA